MWGWCCRFPGGVGYLCCICDTEFAPASPRVNRTVADALARVAGAFNLPMRTPDLVSVAGQGNRRYR
jgi:hypothetical protein